ncbi:MAG: hypothetical protein N6V49_09700 [Serratia symbiotica]|nr:hypothetical protein [Serratia symbiotica]
MPAATPSAGAACHDIGQQVWFYEKPGELIDRSQAARKAEHSDIHSPGYHGAGQDKTNSVTHNS